MKIDDLDWHNHESDPVVRGGHIGMLLRWAATRHMLASEFAAEGGEKLSRVAAGELDPTRYLEEEWDGVLLTDMLTDKGAAFALDEYEAYIQLYCDVAESAGAASGDAVFAGICEGLDKLYEDWAST